MTDPSNYLASFDVLMHFEAGFSDVRGDPGGRTIYGISEVYHPDAWRDGAPTLEFARAWYRPRYWDSLGLDTVSARVAQRLFIAAVNMGLEEPVRCLQRALKLCGYYLEADTEIDGQMGPMTRGAISSAMGECPGDLLARFRAELALFYVRDAQQHPERGEFLGGWLWRACW